MKKSELRNIIREEIFIIQEAANLDILKNTINNAQERVKTLYTKSNKNYNVLPNMLKSSIPFINKINNAFKNFNVVYDATIDWYDSRRKASCAIYFGIMMRDILDKFQPEWETFHREYPYTSKENWVAGKMANISKEAGINIIGGSNNYTTSGSRVYLAIVRGEIN